MMESGRRRSGRLNGATNDNEGSILQVDTNGDELRRRAARAPPNTKESKSRQSLIVRLPIATASLRQLEEYGIIISQDMETVQSARQSLAGTESAESLSDMISSSQATQDERKDDDFPMPPAMIESGRRRSARLNGAASGADGSRLEVDAQEEAPSHRSARQAQKIEELESKGSLIVKLPIATDELRRLQTYGIIVSQGAEVVQPAPQSLAEAETGELLNETTAASKPELHALSKSPPASDITRSHAMSPRLQADGNEYPGDDGPALPPIVYPTLPRTIPWSAYKAFNIPLPTDQVMPPVALETQFQPPLAAPAAPPRLPDPYHSAPPSMLAEVLEMTRHQARLQVLQSSALRCLSNYHYWSIHNPILSAPYKVFFRALERELNGELQKAGRRGKILEQMQVQEWVEMERLLDEARNRETPHDNSVLNHHQTLHAGGAISDDAEMTSCESLKPNVPSGPGMMELEIRARSNPKANSTWSSSYDPQPLADKDAVPLDAVAELRPSPGGTKPAPGPLEMAIRAELEKNTGTDIRQAKRKGALIELKAKAPTKGSASTKKQLRVQVRPGQPGPINTPPPTGMAGAKNPQSSMSSDSAATEIEKEGTLKDIANVVQQQLEQPPSSSHGQGGFTKLIWNPQVPTPEPQQPQFTQWHYQQQLHQQLQLQQPRISQPAYPPSQYRQPLQLQPQLQLPPVPMQQHPFEQNRLQQLPIHQTSHRYTGSSPGPLSPRNKPWEAGYHQQRDLVLDPPPMPSNWRPVQLFTNQPPFFYYLQLFIFRQQFTRRLQLLSGHLELPHKPGSRNVNHLPAFGSQPSSSNLNLPNDYTERVKASGKMGFSAFVEPWKCPTADPGARCQPAGNYKILLWQHPLTLDLPTEFLEQGALEPPRSDSSEESSPARRRNRTSHGGRLSGSSLDEAPETTRISSGDESCYATILSPHVPAQQLVPLTHVVTGRDHPSKTATPRPSSRATRPEESGDNTDGQYSSAMFANPPQEQKLVAPVASMYEPPTLAPPGDETPLFLGADSPGESVYIGETDDPWEFSAPMDDNDPPTQTFTGFTDGGFEEPGTSQLATIINRLLQGPKAKSSSEDSFSSGIPATSKPKARTALGTNTSGAGISGNAITPNTIARGPSIQPTTAPGKAPYTGPPITIPRTLLQKPPTSIPGRLITSHEALAQPNTAPASRPINLGHLLKNIHPPVPRRNTSLPTSAQPPPSRNRQTGPKITAEDRKKITMLKNAEERRKQREADDAKEVVTVNGKGVREEKDRELTGAEVARQIIARKYGEGGARRIYLTPEDIGGGAGGRGDKGDRNVDDVGGLVLDDRVGHEGELLPIEVAEAMRQVPGKQRRRP